MTAKTLAVSQADFLMAFTDRYPESEWYLDRQTGELIFISPDVNLDEEHELDIESLMAQEPERFLVVEPVSSRDAYRLMERFIEQLDDVEAAKVLTQAINQKRAFFQFKDRLHDYPALREQWFAFEAHWLAEMAEQWLAEEGIVVTWITRLQQE